MLPAIVEAARHVRACDAILLGMTYADSSSRSRPSGYVANAILLIMALAILTGCSSRQVQDSMAGSTAQRLVTHAIDDMIESLPAADFEPLRGQSLFLQSHFIERDEVRRYADQRLAIELQRRFGIRLVANQVHADQVLNVFYTSLATDQGLLGFYLPLGFVPGVAEETRINLITLEQFHGIAELYYFLGASGSEERGPLIQARTRTDAVGLPIITIPISNLD